MRFTTNGGVHVNCSKLGLQGENTFFRFQVEDTGCGVAVADQEHLFEEFWGTSSTSANDGSSTGLGLPISKHLVEMMGGSIGFESTLGNGSVFWFELPLESPGEEEVAIEKSRLASIERSAHKSGLPLLNGHVLLAEDNPANQQIGQAILKRIGLRVTVVANGHEAVEALNNGSFEFILMDINMPEMNGIEATSAIRKLTGAVSSVPIIAMTAQAMPGDRERFLSQGMDGYISKPIFREELHACIEQVLKGREPLPAILSDTKDIGFSDAGILVFDAGVFGDLTIAVGAEKIPGFVNLYLSEASAQVGTIVTAAGTGNCDLVANESHKLKSSSGYLGAVGIADLAGQLERAGRERNLKKIALDVSRLPGLLEQTREKLLNVDLAIL